jgi:hypothetical protein
VTPRLALATLLALCAVPALADEVPASAVTTVDWFSERCDYVLTKNADGYGVVLKFNQITFEPGDTIVGDLSRIKVTKWVEKGSTGEGTMMRGLKYGVRRKEAVGAIKEWSRYCKPPLEDPAARAPEAAPAPAPAQQ